MGRPQGSRNTLVRVDYDVIGALVGVRGNTAQAYARRGQYDSRSLDSVLRWINGRRRRQGLPLVGLPDGDAPQVPSDVTEENTPVETDLPIEDVTPAVLAGSLLIYDPATGEYRET